MIGAAGEQLGVLAIQDAIRIAREQGYDLVEVAPTVSPPVCKIMDFNKFKYEQEKKEREARKKHHLAKLKEIKFRPHIETHDYQVKFRQAQAFLMRGDKVKVTLMFRGREMSHIELGKRVLDRLTEDLKGTAKVEQNPSLEGRFMTMVLLPDHDSLKRAKQSAGKKSPAKVPGGSTDAKAQNA